jgi:hypothetical protein
MRSELPQHTARTPFCQETAKKDIFVLILAEKETFFLTCASRPKSQRSPRKEGSQRGDVQNMWRRLTTRHCLSMVELFLFVFIAFCERRP